MSFLRFPTSGKSKRRQYDPKLISIAYEDIKTTNISVSKAAKLYGVPESTLRDRTLGLQPVPVNDGSIVSPGPMPTFYREEETKLLKHVSYMSGIGYSYSRKEFLSLATAYAISLKRKTPADPSFTQSWYNGYKRRNPELALAKQQKLDTS